ncbi:MAG: sigma 54-interacting transcriptional regulator, partial [Kangiellaceae bacterium]|nr:sigma 54-interacting transcriptional regulator [Kangiellaceae bacterium]
VGSNRTLDANVRVVSATNADLSNMISEGGFRQDLYYRLNTVELKVPSLAERRADIIPLAEYFLRRYCQKYNKPLPTLTNDAVKAMQAYDWPGNIRELSHLMERILFTCKDSLISSAQLNLNDSGNLLSKSSLDDAKSTLEEIEKSVLISRLELYEGNVTETAKSLGLSRSGYYRRAQKFGLD